MTPKEALQILDGAASIVGVGREGHAQIQKATAVLTEVIKPKEEVKEDKPEEKTKE